MSVSGSSGTVLRTAGVQHDEQLIASVPAGAYVSKIDISGRIAVVNASSSLTAGTYGQSNIAAGVQIGPHGYAVVPIIHGTTEGVAWVSWGNLVPPAQIDEFLAGTSPIAYVQNFEFPFGVSLRQLIYCAAATDFYACIGENTALTWAPLFEARYTYYVEWATYP